MSRPQIHYPPIPYDFHGRNPEIGSEIHWVPKQLWRRSQVKGVGRLESVNPDGTFTVSYILGMGVGYKKKELVIEPFQVIGYRTQAEKRFIESSKRFASLVKGMR